MPAIQNAWATGGKDGCHGRLMCIVPRRSARCQWGLAGQKKLHPSIGKLFCQGEITLFYLHITKYWSKEETCLSETELHAHFRFLEKVIAELLLRRTEDRSSLCALQSPGVLYFTRFWANVSVRISLQHIRKSRCAASRMLGNR